MKASEVKYSDENWQVEHLTCPYRFRDAQRSELSRMYLCSWSFTTCRCMKAKCPLLPSEGEL